MIQNSDLQSLINKEISQVKLTLTDIFRQQKPLISEAHVKVLAGGKLMRSSLLILSYKMLSKSTSEEQNKKVAPLASAIELLHIASLLHDDIVDKSDQRRGLPSMNESLGTEMALLLGDLQLAESLKLFSEQVDDMKDFHFFRDFINSGHTICHGQIREIKSKPDVDLDKMKANYFKVAESKTGELIGFTTGTGAFLAEEASSTVDQFKKFGLLVGTAFQIIDDILDFVGTTGKYQKSLMRDLYERRLSLPIIYALSELPDDSAVQAVYIKKHSDPETIVKAHEQVMNSQGIKKAFQDAENITQKAIQLLPNGIANPYKKALEDFCLSSLHRKG